MNAEFWRGRPVFLTGHTGFKGAWLSLWLQRLGASVTGFALAPPTRPSLYEAARVAEGMASVLGDIRDAEALAAAMRAARPEVVIHMAAQALVRPGYADPVGTYATNVMGTVHLYEAVRQAESVRAVLSITSDKCYDNREWLWGYRESEPMGGRDPYSSSKGCAELVSAAYRDSYFSGGDRPLALATARAGNVIGGGDWAQDRLIPDLFRAFGQGTPVQIRNPHAIRPWQHVLEPLSGYLMLAEKLHLEGAAWVGGWNFGPADSDARPVRWIVERLIELWGDGAPSWQRDAAHQPHEAAHLKLDCSKANHLLGWRPHWNLDQALARCVEWQQAWRAGADMRQRSLGQIAAFSDGM